MKYKIRLRLIMEYRGANGHTNAVQEVAPGDWPIHTQTPVIRIHYRHLIYLDENSGNARSLTPCTDGKLTSSSQDISLFFRSTASSACDSGMPSKSRLYSASIEAELEQIVGPGYMAPRINPARTRSRRARWNEALAPVNE